MSISDLSAKSARARRQGAVPVWVVVTASVMVLFGLGYWLFSSSPEELLETESPTPKQIKQIATTLLLHENPKIRSRASEKLYSCGDTAVPVLREVALDESDSKLRVAVLGVLAPMDAQATMDVVEKLAKDADPEVRRVAVDTAGNIEDPRAIRILENALKDPETSVRLAATDGLMARRKQASPTALRQALKDDDITVRRHAAKTLRKMNSRR